jgi:hypothetical protein
MLTKKESLLLLAEEHGLTVYDTLPETLPINGLFIEKGNRKIILMKPSLPDSKYIPVLVEEMGHFVASSGVVVELDGINHIKSENCGRSWAYEFLLPICRFALASALSGCKTSADYAEVFSLDEEFVSDAIQYHKRKGHWDDSLEAIFKILVKSNYREILRREKIPRKEVV